MSQLPLSTVITIIIQLSFIAALFLGLVFFIIHAIYHHRKREDSLVPYVIVIMIALLIGLLSFTLGWS